MLENDVPSHLCKIGNLVTDGWKKLAREHGLKINIMDAVPPLTTFDFDYGKKNLKLQTLFTQEMLNRGFLASKSVYVSYSHNEQYVEKYMENVNDVFGLLQKAIVEDDVNNLLKGPVAHVGFKRLT